MPRILSITEIRFVRPQFDDRGNETWVHPDGYKFEIISDPDTVELRAEFFDRAIIKSRDQVRLCGEVDHDAVRGGCGGWRPQGDIPLCEKWLRDLTASSRTAERTLLVRITIPIDPHG